MLAVAGNGAVARSQQPGQAQRAWADEWITRVIRHVAPSVSSRPSGFTDAPGAFVFDRFLTSQARSGFKICRKVCRLTPSFCAALVGPIAPPPLPGSPEPVPAIPEHPSAHDDSPAGHHLEAARSNRVQVVVVLPATERVSSACVLAELIRSH